MIMNLLIAGYFVAGILLSTYLNRWVSYEDEGFRIMATLFWPLILLFIIVVFAIYAAMCLWEALCDFLEACKENK